VETIYDLILFLWRNEVLNDQISGKNTKRQVTQSKPPGEELCRFCSLFQDKTEDRWNVLEFHLSSQLIHCLLQFLPHCDMFIDDIANLRPH